MEIIELPPDTLAKVGRISTAWAKVEFSVDLMNGVIFMWHKARTYEKRIPLALETKLKFLRRAANRISTLENYKAEMIELAAQALEYKKGRHTLAHGVPRSYGEDGITYVCLANLNDNLAWEQRVLSEEFLSEFANYSEQLGMQAFALCHRFVDQWIEESQEANRQLRGG